MVLDKDNGLVSEGGTGGNNAGDGIGEQNNGLRRDGNELRQDWERKGDTGNNRV